MNQIEILVHQTENAYAWTNKLLNTIPQDFWDNTPEIIETNVTWQVGHLIMSLYYHSIMVIKGHQMDIIQKVPLKEYDELFTNADPKKAIGKANPQHLQDQFTLIQQKSINVIKCLSIQDLESNLEPTQISHPIAKNKFEAIDWNIKHTMWHCGQIGIIKRIISERYDFGLKKTN